MYCGHCGARLAETIRFCVDCGAPLRPDELPDPLARPRHLAAQGNPAAAVAALRAMLADDPDDRYVRLGLAAVSLQTGDWAAGLAELERLRATGPFEPIVEAYAAGALLELGRVGEAQVVLEEARAGAPDDFFVAMKRGELFCRLGIYPTAVAEFNRALSLAVPDDATRQAVRDLLAFARERSRRGFVRRLLEAAPAGRRAAANVA